MDEKEFKLEDKLKSEAFSNIVVHKDKPGAYYPEHTHSKETAHIILEGEIYLTVGGTEKVYREGDRVDVPMGQPHSAKVGPEGCRYVIGER